MQLHVYYVCQMINNANLSKWQNKEILNDKLEHQRNDIWKKKNKTITTHKNKKTVYSSSLI